MRAGFVNTRGATRAGEESEQITTTVVMVVTDKRVFFVKPTGEILDRGSVEYGDIAAVNFEKKRTTIVKLTTTGGVAWHFAAPESNPQALDAVKSHLSWIGRVRRYVVRFQNDIEMAAGQIRDHAEEMEWQEAAELYDQKRDELDELINAVLVTRPVDDLALAPELTDVERTLEDAHVRLYIERAQSELDLGEYLIENEEYDRAKEVLERAQKYYKRARNQSGTVQRVDAFQFGTQRELEEDLESLSWEMESVAAEPLRQASEAKIEAEDTEDPNEAIEHWQDAFDLYSLYLTMELGDDKENFADDAGKALTERADAAERLIDLHSGIAHEQWSDGADHQRAGERKAAIRRMESAREHLEHAHELATEFNPVRASELESQLTEMTETVTAVRSGEGSSMTGNSKPDSTSGSREADMADTTEETAEDAERSDDSAETAEADNDLPTVSELLEMDTHHEITLDALEPQPDATGEKQEDTSETAPTEDDLWTTE